MTPIVVSVGPLTGASATNILTASQPAAGTITLNGSLVNAAGVAVLDKPRRILFTTNSTDSTNSFVVTGTNWSGQTISETVPFPASSTGYTALDYATVTSIVLGKTLSANISIGTNGIASSPWVKLDPWALPQTSIQCVASGTVNYTVQQTMDDPNHPSNPVAMANVTWSSSLDTNAVAATATVFTYFAYAPTYARVLLNSGSGSVTGTFAQSGVVSR